MFCLKRKDSSSKGQGAELNSWCIHITISSFGSSEQLRLSVIIVRLVSSSFSMDLKPGDKVDCGELARGAEKAASATLEDAIKFLNKEQQEGGIPSEWTPAQVAEFAAKLLEDCRLHNKLFKALQDAEVGVEAHATANTSDLVNGYPGIFLSLLLPETLLRSETDTPATSSGGEAQ